jgi:thiol-disulfide isomerase/thioredoxin
VWFWAPWCEVCSHEAPAIEQLAASARDELTVIAIGGRDKAANGPAFVTRHRLRTPTVLFDEPMAAWQAYRIPGQPAAVLLDRAGRERGRWLGPFDNAEVLAATRGSSPRT